MPKINEGYLSLFDYFVHKKFPGAVWLDEHLYPDRRSAYFANYDTQSPPAQVLNPQLFGGLQPIVDMRKDLVDTFKPYKIKSHIGRDFMQPVRGLGNIAKGVAILPTAVVVFVANIVRYAFISADMKTFKHNMVVLFRRTFAWSLDSISNVVRGVTQVLTTPLTWCIKMPLRCILTAVKGFSKIEQNRNMQRIAAEGKKAVEDESFEGLDAARHTLSRKFHKAIERGQKSDISLKDEKEYYDAAAPKMYGKSYIAAPGLAIPKNTSQAALQYYGLFNCGRDGQRKEGLPLLVDSAAQVQSPNYGCS